MNTQESSHNFYTLTFGKLGCEARGIDLKKDVSKEVIAAIKNDVMKHRILIFKDQGIISGDRHVEIAKWFGEPDSTFYKHPRSPHPDVFRVSNDRSEGCTNVGRTGWHIDGSFQEAPFAYSLYHMSCTELTTRESDRDEVPTRASKGELEREVLLEPAPTKERESALSSFLNQVRYDHSTLVT
nr:alpha-ketoglutarate-dependent sulfate ester dioxygenase-like [Cherax quadricarinatus]